MKISSSSSSRWSNHPCIWRFIATWFTWTARILKLFCIIFTFFALSNSNYKVSNSGSVNIGKLPSSLQIL